MDELQEMMLEELVKQDRITQKQAEIFSEVHSALLVAGIMQ